MNLEQGITSEQGIKLELGLRHSARVQARSSAIPPPAPQVTAPKKRKSQQASTGGKGSKKTKETYPSTTADKKGKGRAVSAPPCP